MSNNIFRLLVILGFIVFSNTIFSQKTPTKAADEAFEDNKYTLAIEKYKKSICQGKRVMQLKKTESFISWQNVIVLLIM